MFQKFQYVHCDLKPDNILVKIEKNKLTVKIIDFGSSFKFGKISVSGATPEYMSPEFLNYLGKLSANQDKNKMQE